MSQTSPNTSSEHSAKPPANPLPSKRPRGRPRAPGESLEAARRRKETALADLREQEVKRRAEKLLNAEAVDREWRGTLRSIKAAMIAVTSRVRAQLPHLSTHDAAVIDREIRAALTAAGEGRADEYADAG